MTIDISEQLLLEISQKGIVVMAGAGVSAAAPSLLPGWYPLNHAIFSAICDRVDNFMEIPDYTADIRTKLCRY